MRNIFKRIFPALIVPVLTVLSLHARSERPTWDDGADSRKADYVYMESLRLKALDSIEPHFHLIEYSYNLDPSQVSLGKDVGYFYLMLSSGDSVLVNKGYDMLRTYFESNPADYYGSSLFGEINDRLNLHEESLRVWEVLDSIYPDKPDVSLKLASALASQGDSLDLRRSIEVLNKIERSVGKDIGLTSNRIRSLMMLQDTVGVYNEMEDLLKALPRSSDARIYVGDVYSILNRPDDAIGYYNLACEMDSANGLAYYRRANFYRRQGDSIAYDREVFRALVQPELDLDVKTELLKDYIAALYEDPAQQPRIEQLFNILLDEHPHATDIRHLYVSFLWLCGDIERAAEQSEYIVDLDPANLEQWITYAGLVYDIGDWDRLIDVLDRALSYHPDTTNLLLLKATALQMQDRCDEAIKLLVPKFQDPATSDRNEIARTLGDIYQTEENQQEAIKWYDAALEIKPYDFLTLNNYAYYLSCIDMDLEKAERMSAETLRYEPLNFVYLDTYAWILFKQKKYDKAKEYIDRVLEHASDDDLAADYYEHAGDIYFMNGYPEEAVEYWEQALRLDPDNELLQRKVKHKTYFYK